MAGRVDWARHPSDVEAAVAMFIASEHPHAERITPSRGDGGIDILDRDGGRTVVYQVKGFTDALTSGQKKQIEDSIDRVVSDPRWAHLTIDEWHLVMPLDRTPEVMKWLSEYATSKGLPEPIWDGLTRCDLWASDHPYVVDYYFHGNRERIMEAARGLLAGLKLVEDVATPNLDLTPESVSTRLGEVVAFLNEQHPFYSFGIDVQPVVGDPEGAIRTMFMTEKPGLVESVVRANQSVAVRVDVYAKTALSTDLCPITGTLSFTVKEGSDEALAIQDWIKHGSPLELPPGSVQGVTNSPGGLGGHIESASLSLWPVQEPGPQHEGERRLIVFDRHGTEVVRMPIFRSYVTYGLPNKDLIEGLESKFFDRTRHLNLIFRFDVTSQTGTLRMDFTSPTGVPVEEAYLTLRALDALMTDGNTYVIAPRSGPIPDNRSLCGGGSSEQSTGLRGSVAIARALTLIQEHTPLDLLFPDLDQCSSEMIGQILATGAILDGQTVGIRVSHVESEHDEDEPSNVEESSITRLIPWAVRVPEGEVSVGDVLLTFAGTVVEAARDTDHGPVDVWEVPTHQVIVRKPRSTETDSWQASGNPPD